MQKKNPKQVSKDIIEILRAFNSTTLDISQFEAYLSDMLLMDIDKKRHINLLDLFSKTRYFNQLKGENDIITELKLGKYTNWFRDDYGLVFDQAYWVVIVWSFGLKLQLEKKFEYYYEQYESIQASSQTVDMSTVEIDVPKVNPNLIFSKDFYFIGKTDIVIPRSFESRKTRKRHHSDPWVFTLSDVYPNIRTQLEAYFQEGGLSNNSYKLKPILIIHNNQLDIKSLIQEIINPVSSKKYSSKKKYKSPFIVSADCSVDKFYAAFREDVLVFANKNRKFRRLYWRYLSVIDPEYPDKRATVSKVETKTSKSKLKISTRYGTIKVPIPWKREKRIETYKHVKAEGLIRRFFRHLLVNFSNTHSGRLFIIVVKNVYELTEFQGLLKEIRSNNKFIRIVATIDLYNFTKSLINSDVRNRIQIYRNVTVANCPHYLSEENIRTILDNKNHLVDIPDFIVKGINFLSVNQGFQLEKVITDDQWEITEGEISIPKIAVRKYFRASKYQNILEKNEDILLGLKLYSTLFDEETWQYRRMYLNDILFSIYQMNQDNGFSYQGFMSILRKHNQYFSVDDDEYILHNRIIKAMISNKILETNEEVG